MKRQLIVTADDVGLDPGMTEGAIRAHREGIVTACSVVANGAAFDDAVERLRDVPSLEVGVHLALVEERSLTGLRMPRKYTTFLPLYLARVLSIAAIERELRAQIERVLGTGLRVTHLNGHQHLHMLPRVFRVVARLASEYEIPYVRIIDDRGVTARSASMSILSALGRLARDSALMARRPLAGRSPGRWPGRTDEPSVDLPASGRRAITNDHTIGVGVAGHLEDVVPLLDHVSGVTELVTHPGVGVRGYSDWGYAWERETAALCDPRLREELSRRSDIKLTSPLGMDGYNPPLSERSLNE